MRPSSAALNSLVTCFFCLLSCTRSATPATESETHFLSECSETCDEGLECLCGACTRPCDVGSNVCSSLASGATCVESPVVCGRPGPATVCDVACNANSDCGALEGDATCVDGNCRLRATGAGSGGSGTGGSSAGTAGSGPDGAGAGGGDGPTSCEEYVDPTDPPSVTFTITNRREGPIQLGGQGCQTDHVAVVSDNDATPGEWHGSQCLFSCETVRSGNVGCNASCPIATPIVLRAGESANVEWAGLVGESVAFDSTCCEGDTGCPTECSLLRAAAPGAYTATVAYAPISESTAAACEADQFNCPLGFGGSSPTLEEISFTLGSGPVALDVAGGAAPPPTCDELAEPAAAVPVSLTVENTRSGPIVLDSFSDCPEFFTIDSLNETTLGSWHVLWCGGDCSSANGPQPTCGACETPEPIVLGPGETTTFEWPGLVGGNLSFPEECCDAPPCPNTCTQQNEASPGEYQVNLRVADATEEEAAACEMDPASCPASLLNGGNSTPLSFPFEHTGDGVTIEVPDIE